MKTISELNHSITNLKELATGIATDDFFQEAAELSTKLSTGKFYLVVVGIFKRGKSTLINALLGKPLAPVAVTPLTAIVTLFEYGKPSAEIYFTTGEKKTVGVSNVEEYISEEKNPDNAKNVSLVKIFDDNPLLQNITLVDTPGIGSVLEHNTKATYSFVPKIDAALFVLSADTPMSKQDAEFLRELKSAVPKIIYLLNKADLLSPNELQKMLAYNKQTIQTVLANGNESIELLVVSAKQFSDNGNTESHIPLLKNKIEQLATIEKDELIFQSGLSRFKSLTAQLETLLKLKLEALQSPVQQLEEKRAALQQATATMFTNKDEFDILIKGRIKQLQTRIEAEVNKESRTIQQQMQLQLGEQSEIIMQQLRQNGSNSVQLAWSKNIVAQFEKLQAKLETDTRSTFKSLLEHYSSQSQTFVNELSKNLSALMGFDFNLLIGNFDLNVYSSFYFHTQANVSVPDLEKNFLYRLLPASLVKQKVMDGMRKSVDEIIVANTAGMIYDLTYRIQESFRKFSYDLNIKLQLLLKNMEQIIAQTLEEKSKTEINQETEIQLLKEKMKAIEELKNK
ncbi:MAG: dynamin family protein [Chitinophagales bacterium]|nr:dynamin family protein [Chitinophagales bacterium]